MYSTLTHYCLWRIAQLAKKHTSHARIQQESRAYPRAVMVGLVVGDREARTDGQGGELIDRVAAGAPVRQLLLVELLGHTRMPFAGYRPDHRAGIELAAIDAHRAAEAAADLERRFNDGGARQARRDGLEIRDFAGRAAGGHSVPPRSVRVRCARSSILCRQTVLPTR